MGDKILVDYYHGSHIGGVQTVGRHFESQLGFKRVDYSDAARALNIVGSDGKPLQPSTFRWFEFDASCFLSDYLGQYEAAFEPEVLVVNSIVGLVRKPETPTVSIIQDNEIRIKRLYDEGFIDIMGYNRLYHGFKMLQEKTLRNSDIVVAVSLQTKKDYESEFPFLKDRIRILNNGVDTTFWKPLENKGELKGKHSIPNDKRVVVWNGSFTPLKGWHIMKDLISHYKSLFFICIFKHPVGSQPFSDNVKVVSEASPETVRELYNCADFAVQPSLIENDSCVCAEEQSCDLPLITSRVGYYFDCNGPDSKQSRGNNDFGMTVTDWSFEGFREAVDFMLEDLDNDREFWPRKLIFAEKRDLDSWVQRWDSLLAELKNKDHGGGCDEGSVRDAGRESPGKDSEERAVPSGGFRQDDEAEDKPEQVGGAVEQEEGGEDCGDRGEASGEGEDQEAC